MSIKKVVGLLAGFALAVGLLAAGVGAVFTDSVTAKENINVGTFSCGITTASAGATYGAIDALGYAHTVSYTAPDIMSSAAGSAPFSFTVKDTGSIADVLTVATSPVSAPWSIIGAPFVPVPLAAGASTIYNTGVSWTELSNANLGQSGTVTWTVSCGEAPVGPALNVGFYTTTGSGATGTTTGFCQYNTPQASVGLGTGNGTASQVVNADGSVTLSLADVSSYGDTGFYVPLGTLGSVTGYGVTATSGTVATNLYLDRSGDGIFGSWLANNCFNGLNGDAYGLGSVKGANLTVDGSYSFQSWQNAPGGPYTITQLKTPAVQTALSITGSTQVWAWVGIQTNSGSASATITAAP